MRAVRPALHRPDLPDDLPEDAAQRPLRRGPRQRPLRGQAGDALRVAEGLRALGAAAGVGQPHRPICARRSTISSRAPPRGSTWSPAAIGRCRPGGRRARMSTLERKLDAHEFVVTAELPVIDGGGHAEIQRQLEPMRPYVDAFNATDNPSAHAHVSPLAVAIGLMSVRSRAGDAADLPRPQPARAGGRADGRLAARDREHLLPDRRRRDRRRRARGQARVRPRRPAADLRSPRVLESGHYLSGRAITPAPHFFVGAVENPGAPPLEYRVAARGQEGAGRSALSPAPDLLPARAARAVHARRGARRV